MYKNIPYLVLMTCSNPTSNTAVNILDRMKQSIRPKRE